jgi:hypothetical protein
MKNTSVARTRLVIQTLSCGCLLWAGVAQAVVVTPTPVSLFDQFPKEAQGENGIWLQYRQAGTSSYTDLTRTADYTWVNPNPHFNLPFLIRWNTGRIKAEPYQVSGTILDPTIRVQVQGPFSRLRIQGATGRDLTAAVIWYIYKGATNWNAPLWQSSAVTSFDFEVDCAAGEELFFAVNADGSDANDHSYWENLRLTAVAFPISATPASVYDLFPRNTQGTNGIRLLYRVPGTSNYGDMTCYGDYAWGTPGQHFNFPTLIREPTPGEILAQGYGDFMSGAGLDSVLRIQVAATCARIRLQGATGYNWRPVSYYIYKGATNWANPLWTSGGASSFDFELVCAPGDELFFGVSALGDDRGIETKWLNLTLTGIPPTAQIWPAVEIGWESVSNRFYEVQWRPTLGPTNWLPLVTNVVGSGTYMSVFDSCRSNDQRFYRVIELP